MSWLAAFFRDDSGLTSTEYAFIAALVSVAGIIGYQMLGGSVLATMQGIVTKLSAAEQTATGP